MVPSLTAVDADGRPITPGLLYGDSRGRVSAPTSGMGFMVGEAAEFLRWTAREAPAAAGYWPAPAVANHALAGEAVIDFATAFTTLPLFDGTGWNAAECADCGASVDQHAAGGRTRAPPSARYTTATPCWLRAPSTPSANRWWPVPIGTATCWCCVAPR